MKQTLHRLFTCMLGFIAIGITYAQPANDNVAQAVAIRSLPFETALSSASATFETDEAKPSCNDSAGASVWWKYTATNSGYVKINSNGSDFDTVIAVWTGSTHPLTEVGCNDDKGGEETTSAIGFAAEAGKTYFVQLSGYEAATGNAKLAATMLEPAKNKSITSATVISALPFNVETMNIDGGTDEGEAGASCKPEDDKTEGNSIWWSYTASQDGMLRIDTRGSEFDTILSVWTGNAHPLTEVGCNDDGEGTTSKLNLEVKKGTKYLIRVSGYDNAVGNVSLAARIMQPPKNDHLANATLISTTPYTDENSTTEGATKEESEESASCGSEDNNSIWWKYVATRNGVLSVSTFGTEYDTILTVSESSGFKTAEAGCNDDAGDGQASRLALLVEAGKTYYIRVAGYSGAEGTVKLDVKFGQPPTNGTLATATAITSLPTTLSGNNSNAPSEKEEAKGCGADGMNSIWWKYTPAKDAVLILNPKELGIKGMVSVLQGDAHPLTDLGCWMTQQENTENPVEIPQELAVGVSGGETYYVRVSGINAEEGAIKIAARAGVPPKNGKVANAIPITSFPYNTTASNVGAPKEKDLTDLSCGADVKNTIWWKVTPTQEGLLKVSTEGTKFDTVVGIWTGSGKPETEVGCNDDVTNNVSEEAVEEGDAPPSNQSSLVRSFVEAGKTYFIQVSGYQNNAGEVKLGVTLGKPNAQSQLKNAASIATLPATVSAKNADAAPEAGTAKPSCKEDASNPIWFKFVAKTNAAVLFKTEGSSFDTILSVWEGDAHPLTELACNDDGLEEQKSQIVMDVMANKTYYLRVDGNNAAEGDVVLKAEKIVPPNNANVEKATKIMSLPYTNTSNTLGGGVEVSEEKASCGGEKDGSSVWYSYKATKNGFVMLELQPTAFDGLLSVWTGAAHPLSEVACIDGATAGEKESLPVSTTAGETYFIRVSGYDNAAGAIQLSVKEVAPTPNDNLNKAALISSLPYNNTIEEWFGSVETDEATASCSSDDKNSLWWKFIPTTNRTVKISTIGSEFDTVLSVWTGSAFPLEESGCNDDGEGVTASESILSFDAKVGTVYYIRVNGYNGKTGKLVLKAE